MDGWGRGARIALWAGLCACNREVELSRGEARLDEVGADARRGILAMEGAYFGEIELMAYDHRPGLTVEDQTGGGATYLNTGGDRFEPAVVGSRLQDPSLVGKELDWSVWPVVRSGHDAARDVYLELGGDVDLDALGTIVDQNGDEHPTQYPPDATFVDTWGRFDVDLLVMTMYNPGAVVDGVFYGGTPQNGAGWAAAAAANDQQQQVHPITGEVLPSSGTTAPSMAAYVADVTLPMWPTLQIDGVEQTVRQPNVIFARSDWFPEPLLVWLDDAYEPQDVDQANPQPFSGASVRWSSRPLDTVQEQVLISFLEQMSARGRAEAFVVVPFDGIGPGPVRIVLDDTVTTATPWDTADAAIEIDGDAVAFVVEYDLAQALSDTSWLPVSSATSPVPDPSTVPRPKLVFTGDAAGVPFGIRAAMVDRAATCSNGAQDGDETGVDCGGASCRACNAVTPTDCGGNAPLNEPLYALAGTVEMIRDGLDYASMGVVVGSTVEVWIHHLTPYVDQNASAGRGEYILNGMTIKVGDLCAETTSGLLEVDNDSPTAGDSLVFTSSSFLGDVEYAYLAIQGDPASFPSDAHPETLPPPNLWTIGHGMTLDDSQFGGLHVRLTHGH